jgi:hypothetical protein
MSASSSIRAGGCDSRKNRAAEALEDLRAERLGCNPSLAAWRSERGTGADADESAR